MVCRVRLNSSPLKGSAAWTCPTKASRHNHTLSLARGRALLPTLIVERQKDQSPKRGLETPGDCVGEPAAVTARARQSTRPWVTLRRQRPVPEARRGRCRTNCPSRGRQETSGRRLPRQTRPASRARGSASSPWPYLPKSRPCRLRQPLSRCRGSRRSAMPEAAATAPRGRAAGPRRDQQSRPGDEACCGHCHCATPSRCLSTNMTLTRQRGWRVFAMRAGPKGWISLQGLCF